MRIPGGWSRLAYQSLAWSSLLAMSFKILIHLGFVWLPAVFFLLGLVSYHWNPKKALLIFFFLLPLVNSLPDLFSNGYPFNYMAIILFYLAGLAMASLIRRDIIPFDFAGSRVYLFFLGLLWISAIFLFIRWSNLTLSTLAFMRDTPVAVSGDRLSFASVFPVATLFLFSFSPYVTGLIRYWEVGIPLLMRSLSAGFSVSLGLAVVQKFFYPDLLAQRWWSEKLGQVNGGFSDFNGFGFFAGVLFLYHFFDLTSRFLAARQEKKWFSLSLGESLFFSAVSLTGIILSGSRTAFFFVLAAFVCLFFNKKVNRWILTGILAGLVVVVLLSGSKLNQRISRTWQMIRELPHSHDIMETLNEVTNGRVHMIEQSVPIIGKSLLTGVGTGNFIFAFKSIHFGKNYYLDLPLNQYLLILVETGLIGLAVFCGFFYLAIRRNQSKIFMIILGVTGLIFLFGNPLWLPEVMIVFWMMIAWSQADAKRFPRLRVVTALLVLVFLGAAVLSFDALRPVTWLKNKNMSYDYGFWYDEKDAAGKHFRWSGEAAGIYISPNLKKSADQLVLGCGAPLGKLPGNKQIVDLYWRGHFLKAVGFTENGIKTIPLNFRPGEEGFLELRVRPAFNLKGMGLEKESRTLGVMVFYSPPNGGGGNKKMIKFQNKERKMIIKTLVVGPIAANCFIVGDEEKKTGIVIDPGSDANNILAEIKKSGLTIQSMIATHGHFDHTGGVKELQASLKVPFLIHREDISFVRESREAALKWGLDVPQPPDPDGYLEDGQEIQMGNLTFRVLHTPGHSPGGICLFFPGQKAVFSGDTLFHRSIGRTDFRGGAMPVLTRSIREKLYTLAAETVVYPGHGEPTSIGEEKKYNFFVQE